VLLAEGEGAEVPVQWHKRYGDGEEKGLQVRSNPYGEVHAGRGEWHSGREGTVLIYSSSQDEVWVQPGDVVAWGTRPRGEAKELLPGGPKKPTEKDRGASEPQVTAASAKNRGI